MSEYKLTAAEEPCSVIRTEDSANIPPDMANRDYNGDQFSPGYVQWVEGGGVPDPYVEPIPSEPVPTAEQEVLFDHENRVRALEGQPPLTEDEFASRMTGTPVAKPKAKARK
jgi:hypothetical protein